MIHVYIVLLQLNKSFVVKQQKYNLIRIMYRVILLRDPSCMYQLN